MKRPLVFLGIVVLLCPAVALAQPKPDTLLMSDAQYAAFLSDVESKLPAWEAELRKVDPVKMEMSYAEGQKAVFYRDLALNQIGGVRTYVQKERARHRISQEKFLEEFLQGVFDSIEATLLHAPTTEAQLENFGPGLSNFLKKIKNDLHARLEVLDNGICR